MRIIYKKYGYKCNICGKKSEQTKSANPPIGWMEFDCDCHYCNECVDTIMKAEPIDLTKAVIGEKFLTRSGKEATLINIMQYYKRPYVFADNTHVWSTLWNGFVNSINIDDIVKKIE